MRFFVVVLLAALPLLAGCYSIDQYQGDGQLEAPEVPEYRLSLPPLDVSHNGTYTFTGRGLPPTVMHLLLVCRDDAVLQQASQSDVTIDVHISSIEHPGMTTTVNADRFIVVTPEEGRTPWYANPSSQIVRASTEQDLRLNSTDIYTFIFSVRVKHPASAPLIIYPKLEALPMGWF